MMAQQMTISEVSEFKLINPLILHVSDFPGHTQGALMPMVVEDVVLEATEVDPPVAEAGPAAVTAMRQANAVTANALVDRMFTCFCLRHCRSRTPESVAVSRRLGLYALFHKENSKVPMRMSRLSVESTKSTSEGLACHSPAAFCKTVCVCPTANKVNSLG